MPTISTSITPFSVTPSRTQAPTAFEAAFQTYISEQSSRIAQMNAWAVEANALEASILAAQASVAGMTYFRGAWSALTGALTVPSSVAHGGTVWILTQDVADVTSEVPGVSTKWVRSYPHRRVAIFGAESLNLTGIGTGEVMSNLHVTTPLAVGNLFGVVVASSGGFIAYSSSTTTGIVQSTDGRTWASKTLASSSLWRAAGCSSGTFVAVPEGGTSCQRSTDNGATWATVSLGGVTAGAGISRLVAGDPASQRVIVALGGITTVTVSTNGGATWTAAQTLPVTPQDLFVLPDGTFAMYQSTGAAVYRSTTGLTSSWTATAVPAGVDTVAKDTDGSLLGYAATDSSINVYRSTDAGATWVDLGWTRPIAAAVRSINGIYVCCNNVAQAFTRHGGEWVPRLGQGDFSNRPSLAKVGNVYVYAVSSSKKVAVYDPTAADAKKTTME